jgi:hypothetical protein
MKNKRGAESFTVILWIIVGVIVVGLFVYAYYNGFIPVIGGTKNLPKQMEIAIQACTALGEIASFDYSYCRQARDTAVSESKVTCQYLSEKKLINTKKDCKNQNGEITNSRAIAVELCQEENAAVIENGMSLSKKYSINEVKCSDALKST